MVGRTSNRHTSTSTQAIGLGVLVMVMLASPSSSAPFSHHRPHSLEVQTTPTAKLNVDQPSIHQARSQTYLEDQLKILYDHLDQQASNSLRPNGGHHPSSAGLNFQSTVHPLNRRKGEERTAVSRREKERLGHAASKMVKGGGEIFQSEMGKRQVEGAYLPNQYAPLAQPQAGAPDPDSDSSQQTISVPMVGRIGAASTSADSPAATSTPAAVNSASSSPASQSPPTQSQSQSQSQSSSDSKPTSSSSPTQSQSSASKTQTRSTSSKSPTSTNAQDQDQDNEAVSVFDKKNHLFPLVAAGIVGAGLFAIILLISIARACAHWRMRSNGGKLDENGNLTGGAGGIKTGRSLRRAITGRKLGSFQRRNREGSVLIEVGDEVFAVPPHIAEEYHRRQKQAANPSANSSVLGRAADSRGLDLQSWRLASAAVPVDGPKRSLSARLMESLRALRGSAEGDDLDDEKTCYSFDSEKQMKGQMRQSNPNAFMPVITKGNGAWNISSSDDSSSDDHHSHQRQRRFNQGPRETPQLGRPYLPVTPKPQTPRTLSHERVQLSDGPVSTPNVPGGFPGEGRTLQEVKKDEMKKVNRPSSRRNGNGGGGSYRHKKSERPTASDSLSRARSMAAVQRQKSKITSTQHSSPALYTARTQSPPSPKAALQPEKPQRAAKVGEEGRRTPERFRGQEGRANKVSRAPTFRPSLPMPPHLSPIQSSPRIDGWEKKA